MAYATDPTGRGRKARTLTATDPVTGATVPRTTDRVYVAAVVMTAHNGGAYAVAWAGRPDLAAKALAQRGGEARGYRLAPVTCDPWAAPEPAAVAATPAPAAVPLAAATPEPRGPLLPGEPAAPAPVPPAGPAPTLPTLERVTPDAVAPAQAARAAALALEAAAPPAGAGVAAHRAAAAAGRPVSLAALARDLGRGLGLATGGRIPGPAAPLTGDPLEGLPWDPGTPAARARHAEQGRRAAILWPVAQAITGAGHPLPASWASDGPVLNGQVGPVTALAALPAALLESAAAALAALPPVTPAQDTALELVRDALAR
jgi:hypothetical protein